MNICGKNIPENGSEEFQQWIESQRKCLENKLSEKQIERKLKIRGHNEDLINLERKLPMDALAKEWLNDNCLSGEVRVYLIDNLLPTLLMGLEKMLCEVSRKNMLASYDKNTTIERSFQPLTYLAQYLLRNNPRHSNFPEASPYIRGLREVSEKIKRSVYNIEINKLAQVKHKVEIQRMKIQKENQEKESTKNELQNLLKDQFSNWLPKNMETVQLSSLLCGISSYCQVKQVESTALLKLITGTDDEVYVDERKFNELLQDFLDEIEPINCSELIRHLDLYAEDYKKRFKDEILNKIFYKLFLALDAEKLDYLDRERVFYLMQSFWNQTKEATKRNLKNPTKWPMAELTEMDNFKIITEINQLEVEENDKVNSQIVEVETSKEIFNQTNSEANKEIQIDDTDSKKAEVDENDLDAFTGNKIETKNEKNNQKNNQKESHNKNDSCVDLVNENKISSENETKSEEADHIEVKQDKSDEGKNEDEFNGCTDGSRKTIESEVDSESNDISKSGLDSFKSEIRVDEACVENEVFQNEKTGDCEKHQITCHRETTNVSDGHVKEEDLIKKSDDNLSSLQINTNSEKKDDSVKNEAKFEDHAEQVSTETENKSEISGEKEKTSEETESTKLSSNDDTYLNVTISSDLINISDFYSSSLLVNSNKRILHNFNSKKLSFYTFNLMLKKFLNNEYQIQIIEEIINFFHSNYLLSEEEKLFNLEEKRIQKIRQKQNLLVESLFEKMDNEKSGFVGVNKINSIAVKYKNGMDTKRCIQIAKDALLHLKEKSLLSEQERLNKDEFAIYVIALASGLSDEENELDNFLSFALSVIKLPFAERIRGKARRKLINKIMTSAITSGVDIKLCYDALFDAIEKDAELHGCNKKLNAYIGLLESNIDETERGSILLRFVASTSNISSLIIGKVVYDDMNEISLEVARRGRPLYLPSVIDEDERFPWSEDNFEYDGSIIFLPLQDVQGRTFGLLVVDTYCKDEINYFVQHEIEYFEGVAATFSQAFHIIDSRRKLCRVVESSLFWLKENVPSVFNLTMYFVQPTSEESTESFSLCKALVFDKGEIKSNCKEEIVQKDPFQDYLFDCVEASVTTTTSVLGVNHIVFPLRNPLGGCQCLLDLSTYDKIESDEKFLSILRAWQESNHEISDELNKGNKKAFLELEVKGNDEIRTELMFYRIVLRTLHKDIRQINIQTLLPDQNENTFSKNIYLILKMVYLLLYHIDLDELEDSSMQSQKSITTNEIKEESSEVSTEDTTSNNHRLTFKQMIGDNFLEKIILYDPSSSENMFYEPQTQTLKKELTGRTSPEEEILVDWLQIICLITQQVVEVHKNYGPVFAHANRSGDPC